MAPVLPWRPCPAVFLAHNLQTSDLAASLLIGTQLGPLKLCSRWGLGNEGTKRQGLTQAASTPPPEQRAGYQPEPAVHGVPWGCQAWVMQWSEAAFDLTGVYETPFQKKAEAEAASPSVPEGPLGTPSLTRRLNVRKLFSCYPKRRGFLVHKQSCPPSLERKQHLKITQACQAEWMGSRGTGACPNHRAKLCACVRVCVCMCVRERG